MNNGSPEESNLRMLLLLEASAISMLLRQLEHVKQDATASVCIPTRRRAIDAANVAQHESHVR